MAGVNPGWVESFGEIVKFTSKIFHEVISFRALKYFAETRRQAGIPDPDLGHGVWPLVFITGLERGIEGDYFLQSHETSARSRHGATCASLCATRSAT
jgi:hypothetical protein